MRDGHINHRTQDKIRAGIKVGEIVKALQDHCLGRRKMTNTQVRAGEILARKILPDMVAQTLTADVSEDPLLQIVRPDAVQHDATQHKLGEDKPTESAA